MAIIKIPDPQLPEWLKILNTYDPKHYVPGKKVTAEEWNTLFLASVNQGNYLSETVDLLIKEYLPNTFVTKIAFTEQAETLSKTIQDLRDTDLQLQTAVNSAVDTSDSAFLNAQIAKANSEAAVEDATNAVEVSQQANTTAEHALHTSENAVEIAEHARTIAGNADEIARASKTLSESATNVSERAQNIAEGIDAKATSALETANTFRPIAETAYTTSQQAVADSTIALTNSQTALENSREAMKDASEAFSDAKGAVEVANTSAEIASTALLNSTSALTSSAQAVEVANTALTHSEEAVNKSDQATNIANTALTNSQTALTNSETAVSTSDNALQLSTLAKTDAASALVYANEALSKINQAIEQGGTIVTINNDAVASLNFSSDPQTQIDTINSALPDFVKNTDYASSTKAGLVRANSNQGFFISSTTGDLSIVQAQDSDLVSKTNKFRPITSNNLDKAVKVGLTTNTLEWTAEEQAAARALIGASSPDDLPVDSVNLSSDQTITGVKTFDNDVVLNNTKTLKGKLPNGTATNIFNISASGNATFGGTGIGYIAFYNPIRPSGANAGVLDLGATTSMWKDLYLSGALTNGTNRISIANIVDKNNAQTITGQKTFKNTLVADSGAIITGDVTLKGNLYQEGEAYETHAEKIYSTKDYIYLREGAAGALTNGAYTGFEFIKYDGTNNGRLVVDNQGVARVGDVGDEQPLATREESPTNGGFAKWDATNYKFVTDTDVASNTALAATNATIETLNTSLSNTQTTINALNTTLMNVSNGLTTLQTDLASLERSVGYIEDDIADRLEGVYADENTIRLGNYNNIEEGSIGIGFNTVSINESIAIGTDAHAEGTKSIQLGAGQNTTDKSLQVYDDNIYNANTHTLTVENATVHGAQVSTKTDAEIVFAEREWQKSKNLFNVLLVPSAGSTVNNNDGSFSVIDKTFYYDEIDITDIVPIEQGRSYTYSAKIDAWTNSDGTSGGSEIVIYFNDGTWQSFAFGVYANSVGLRHASDVVHVQQGRDGIKSIKWRPIRKNNSTSTMNGKISDIMLCEGADTEYQVYSGMPLRKNDIADCIQYSETIDTSDVINPLEGKANVDLSNVTYPEIVADSALKTGAGDRVIKSYMSSDGLTWYRIWASGWKECGGTVVQSASNGTKKTIALPIAFANNMYTLVLTPMSTTSWVHSWVWSKTTQSFVYGSGGNGSGDTSTAIQYHCSGV